LKEIALAVDINKRVTRYTTRKNFESTLLLYTACLWRLCQNC